MATKHGGLVFLLLAFAFASGFVLGEKFEAARLSVDYYAKTCPFVERIVWNVAAQKLKEAPTTAPGALRIFFHDCFVEGCDASILIASTPENQAERDAEINLSLAGDGFDVFFRAKRALEFQCPGIVSCADVMAIATRDLVSMVGGPYWEVAKGRKDGLISKAAGVNGNLPTVNMTVDELLALFERKGLSMGDMVTLSGGHTIGFAHCSAFRRRIYGYNGTQEVDPTMNAKMARQLQAACPREEEGEGETAVVFNDGSTPTLFDNAYYGNILRGNAVLASDQVLYADPRSRAFVNIFSRSNAAFLREFAKSMIRLANVGVETGSRGDVRRDCAFFNL